MVIHEQLLFLAIEEVGVKVIDLRSVSGVEGAN